MSLYRYYKLMTLVLLLGSYLTTGARAQSVFTPQELLGKLKILKKGDSKNELDKQPPLNSIKIKPFNKIEDSVIPEKYETIKNDDRVLMEILEALTPKKTPANRAKESLIENLELKKNEKSKEKIISLPAMPVKNFNAVNKKNGGLYAMAIYQKSDLKINNSFAFNKINGYLPNNTKTTISTASDNDPYRLVVGYDFDDIESLEVSLPLKKSSLRSSVNVESGNSGSVDYDYSYLSVSYKIGFSLKHYINFPLGFYGKIGGNIINQKYTVRYQTNAETNSKLSLSPIIGFETNYAFDAGDLRLGINYSPSFGDKDVFKTNKLDFYLGFAYYP